MLTRWFSQIPSRIRTLSPTATAQRPDLFVGSNNGNASFIRSQNFGPHARRPLPPQLLHQPVCQQRHSQQRQRPDADADAAVTIDNAVNDVNDGKRWRRDNSWSVNRVNRNNLQTVKAALSDVDRGCLSELEFLEGLERRVPDLPSALALDDDVGGGGGGGGRRGVDETGYDGVVDGGGGVDSSFTYDGASALTRMVDRQSLVSSSSSFPVEEVDARLFREPKPPDPVPVDLEDYPGVLEQIHEQLIEGKGVVMEAKELNVEVAKNFKKKKKKKMTKKEKATESTKQLGSSEVAPEVTPEMAPEVAQSEVTLDGSVIPGKIKIDAILTKEQQGYVKQYQERKKKKKKEKEDLDTKKTSPTMNEVGLNPMDVEQNEGSSPTITGDASTIGKTKKKKKKQNKSENKPTDASLTEMIQTHKKREKKKAEKLKHASSSWSSSSSSNQIYFSASPLSSESSLELTEEEEAEAEADEGRLFLQRYCLFNGKNRQHHSRGGVDTSFAMDLETSHRRSAELAAYLKTCVYAGDIGHAEAVFRKFPIDNAVLIRDPAIERILHLRRTRGEKKPMSFYGKERTVIKHYANLTISFNILMRAFLEKDLLDKFAYFVGKMHKVGVDMDAQTVGLVLIARQRYLDKEQIVPAAIDSAAEQALQDKPQFPLNRLISESRLPWDLRKELKAALEKIDNFESDDAKPLDTRQYELPIVADLNERAESYPNPYYGAFDKEEMKGKLSEAIGKERDGFLFVPNLDEISNSSLGLERKDEKEDKTTQQNPETKIRLEKHRQMWRKTLAGALARELERLKTKYKNADMSIFPYLKMLTSDEIVDVMMEQLETLAVSPNAGHLPLSYIAARLGRKLADIARAKRHPLNLASFQRVYDKYLDFLCAETRSEPTESHFFAKLREEFPVMTELDSFEYYWPFTVRSNAGNLLMDIITGDIMFEIADKSPTNNNNNNNNNKNLLPVFYKTIVKGPRVSYEVRVHPGALQLFKGEPTKPQSFLITEVPMTVPPLPWSGLDTGGNLIQETKAIRMFGNSNINAEYCKRATSTERLSPVLDALNHLGNCPWRVNSSVLDVAISVFNAGGDPKLALPRPSKFYTHQLEGLPKLTPDLSGEERRLVLKTRKKLTKGKMESYSLWCTQSYKLSLASHFRDSVLWYPINMDFRGRVYPVPPHLNHMGDDLVRGILHFAKAKPLGPKGLDWLKIHVINLTGLKKRDSVVNRLIYANEVIDDIIDSARDPLQGRRWWMDSDEPWETLAACMDVADALDYPGGPENYPSRLPVHQDGSCNGLQHYAALGRDQAGGKSVNLCPSEFPQDVYSDVLELVVERLKRDANAGNPLAVALDGVVTRKVIKQTIMTTVYGVTRFGARLQVANRLKEIGFPSENIFRCSLYLAGATLECLEEMFVATRRIQDWFDDIALLVSKSFEKPVTWETPLGLPVMQPYFKERHRNNKIGDLSPKVPQRKCDTQKQKNGFAPNFIHSLDATHMMLTALHAHRKGICYNAVHDCYWTHAADVDELNVICRQQFVRLHTLPILENLSLHVQDTAPSEEQLAVTGGKNRKARLLAEVVEAVPERGELDINDVLKSVYFFS